MSTKLQGKTDELSKIRAEIAGLAPKMGQMYHTPKYDPSYSAVKLDNMEKQMEKLREKEDKILAEIAEVKSSPDFIKEIDAKTQILAAKRGKLRSDLDEIKTKLPKKRYELSGKIMNGGDPLVLVAEIHDLEDRLVLIIQALEAINKASSDLIHISH
jgi:chromosome segregation ATPase